MASRTRDQRIVAAVPCPLCGAVAGQPCRNPVPHQQQRGPKDRRRQPMRPHTARRVAWVGWKKQHEEE